MDAAGVRVDVRQMLSQKLNLAQLIITERRRSLLEVPRAFIVFLFVCLSVCLSVCHVARSAS